MVLCTRIKCPGKVVFQDGKVVFIRHGCTFVRVSPNWLHKATCGTNVPMCNENSGATDTGNWLEGHGLRICEKIGGKENDDKLNTQVSRSHREIAEDIEDTEVSNLDCAAPMPESSNSSPESNSPPVSTCDTTQKITKVVLR